MWFRFLMQRDFNRHFEASRLWNIFSHWVDMKAIHRGNCVIEKRILQHLSQLEIIYSEAADRRYILIPNIHHFKHPSRSTFRVRIVYMLWHIPRSKIPSFYVSSSRRWLKADGVFGSHEGLIRLSKKIMVTYTNALLQKLMAPHP